MIAYLESSVLLRIVLGARNAFHIDREFELVSSSIMRVECLRTIQRIRLESNMSDDEVSKRIVVLERLLISVKMMAPAPEILKRASLPFPVSIKTLDAIHLSTALQISEQEGPLVMLTHDIQLGRAARSMGLDVLGC